MMTDILIPESQTKFFFLLKTPLKQHFDKHPNIRHHVYKKIKKTVLLNYHIIFSSKFNSFAQTKSLLLKK